MAEIILPGTYITVRDEALISAGRVVTGNIGIVGTANKGPVDEVKILGTFTEAREMFGNTDPWQDGTKHELTLIRALEHIYNNGGRTVYAVRTAGSSKSQAAYTTRGAGDAAKTVLKAKTPGTWGNEIYIEITNAEEAASIVEELPGNATNLRRSKVLPGSILNSISVRQASTGKVLRYEIVYDAAVDNAKPQVSINANTGALDFTTLADFEPVVGDTILAKYLTPAANSKKVELTYGQTKERYTVADASHLAELVNNRPSALVVATEAEESSFFNDALADTGGKKLFGTGLNGNTKGDDGANATVDNYKTSLAKLENEIINIVLLAGQSVSDAQMTTALLGHVNATAEIKRERIGIIGSNGTSEVNAIVGQAESIASERLVFVAPGVKISPNTTLPGAYTAAAVAGMISSLPVQASPTNKTLAIPGLSAEFTSSQLEKLVSNRVFAVEKREGYRIVKGITTATNSAWHQVTTRRIVDYAIYGVRSSCNPYIGKLNNDRVRGAMKATLDAFLTRMVEDEALISYELEVSATRAQEIAGEAIVTMTVRPTFSIDFIKVTMFLG